MPANKAIETAVTLVSVGRRAWLIALTLVALPTLWWGGSTAAYGKPSPAAHASVIGGNPASLTDWGFTVGITENGRFICSGSVVSPTAVLTAAHCALDAPSQYAVISGRTNLGFFGGQVLGVSSIAVHPDYATTRLHDLAVLKLSGPTSAPSISLPTTAEDLASTQPGAPLYIAGYGRQNPLAHGRPRTGILNAARVTIRDACFRYGAQYSGFSMICALGKPLPRLVISRATCSGDSGGPLVAYAAAGPRVVGVTSYGSRIVRGNRAGIDCGFWKTPDVYARVAAGLEFIQANLGP